MRETFTRHLVAVTLVVFLFLTTVSPAVNTLDFDTQKQDSSKDSSSVADVPVWRVGDKWKYAGTFDPTKLVVDAGVSATVGEINGDAISEHLQISINPEYH
jgi:hypothetical protein